MILIDEPHVATLSDYSSALDQMVERVRSIPGILSIYQIGGFGAPGISDIDMVCVFEDGVQALDDPQAGLKGTARYLFCHQLFGTSRSGFEDSQRYTSFHNYRLLHGAELRESEVSPDDEIRRQMQTQLAHEYLVRMWINLIVERSYHILKTRSLLLQGNGLNYDLEFLGAKPEGLSDCIDQIMKWRAEWFDDRPSDSQVAKLHSRLFCELDAFLKSHFKSSHFFLPQRNVRKVGHNIYLNRADQMGYRKSIPTLPWVPKMMARKAMALQSRLMDISVRLPFRDEGMPSHISQSFNYTQRVWTYNRTHLPFYMPLTSSLVLQS